MKFVTPGQFTHMPTSSLSKLLLGVTFCNTRAVYQHASLLSHLYIKFVKKHIINIPNFNDNIESLSAIPCNDIIPSFE